MKLLIGNFKGPEGKQGKEGPQGKTGDTGPRGSRWESGTAITGTSTIGKKYPNSGITDARLNDYYINTETGNLYECTVAGESDTAEWTWIGNFKGPTGATGPAGSISDINNQKPTYEEATKLENINSGETVQIAFGKFKKAISVLIGHYTQKATASILGHVRLSNSTDITTTGEYALDAVEKNAAVAGTLANQIAQQNSKKVNFTDIIRSAAVTEAGKKALDAIEKNAAVEGTMANEIGKINSNLSNTNTELDKKTQSIKNDINYETNLTRTYQLEPNKAYLVTVFPYSSNNVADNGYNLGVYFVFTAYEKGKSSVVKKIIEENGLEVSVDTDCVLSITSGFRYMHYSITRL